MIKTTIPTLKRAYFAYYGIGITISIAFYTKKNKATPTIVIKVPITSLTDIFCLWMMA